MVIAGLYIVILSCLFLNLSLSLILSDFHLPVLHCYAPLIVLSILLHSSILSLSVLDAKSIIALSIIGQLAYILLSSHVSSNLSLHHVLVHSHYKCFLFLLSAEVIYNTESSRQSIHGFHANGSLVRSYHVAAGLALLFASTKEGILHAAILSHVLLLTLLLLSSILSLLYVLLLLLLVLSHSPRVLLSLSTLAFPAISLAVLLADKSLHYSVHATDLPDSQPLLSPACLSSVSLLLLHLLLTLSNAILLVSTISRLAIHLSFPFPFLSPDLLSSRLLISPDVHRFPILVLDLFGRFRAMDIVFLRSELLLIIAFAIVYISHNEIITS